MVKVIKTKAIRTYQEFLDSKGANKEAYQAEIIPIRDMPYKLVELEKTFGVTRGTHLYPECTICGEKHTVVKGGDVVAIKTRRKGTDHTDKQWVLICKEHFLTGWAQK